MDETLQELLRRWKGGDLEAQARYLIGRLRIGELQWGAIELGAYLGDVVCQRLLGEDAVAFLPPTTGLSLFLRELPRPDQAAFVRGLCSVLREVQHSIARELYLDEIQAIEAMEAWTEDPNEATRVAVDALFRQLSEDQEDGFSQQGFKVGDVREGITLTAWLTSRTELDVHAWYLVAQGVGRLAGGKRMQDACRLAVRQSLLPWILTRPLPPKSIRYPAVSDLHTGDDDAEFQALMKRKRAYEQHGERLRRNRLEGAGPEALFSGGEIEPNVVAALLDKLPTELIARGKLTDTQGLAVVRTFYEVCGWTPVPRSTSLLTSPSGDRRLRFKKKVLLLLEEFQGACPEITSAFGEGLVVSGEASRGKA